MSLLETNKKSQLLAQHIQLISVIRIERDSKSFLRGLQMLLCVPERLSRRKFQQPRSKTHHPNVSQSSLSLYAAQGLCETSERIWSILWWGDGISPVSPLLLACPCHGDVARGGFLYLSRCHWRGGPWFLFSLSNSNQDLAIHWVEKKMSKQERMKISKEGKDGRCSIWTCLPLRSSRLENVLLPSHSTLYLAVVDLSPTSHPPYCECRCQIEGFSQCKA